MTDEELALAERAGHTFARPELLATALTHRSWAHENGTEDNERLEFLGDAVLQTCSTMLLMERFPDAREGELSRLRSRVVSTRALARVARELKIGPLLKLGVGEEATGGRTRARVLACAVEALLGAIFTDAGFEVCPAVVQRWIGVRIDELESDDGEGWKDPRSRLQELTQRLGKGTPTYRVVETDGPAHALVFAVQVEVDGDAVGSGLGSSKREAYRDAAEEALATMEGP
jgi:ribonuclease-3